MYQGPDVAVSPERPKVALLIVTSERKLYLNLLVLSLRLRKLCPIDHVLVVDTSKTSSRWHGESYLQRLSGEYELMSLPGTSFHRVLRHAWSHLEERVGATHVLMFEEDFLLLRRLPIERLVALADAPGTLQVVFPRQRWFEAEYRYPDRRAYLRAQHAYRDTPDGDRLEGFFTSNPHCMRLDRVLPLLQDVPASDDYTWESDYADASVKHSVGSLQLKSTRPWVWHIGAATSNGVRTSIEAGKSTPWVYFRAHAKRAMVISSRIVSALYARAKE